MVGLEVGLFTIDHLVAIVVSLVNDVKGISNLALENDILAWLSADFFHGINDYVEIILVEVFEEDAFLYQRFDFLFGLGLFGDNLGLKRSFLIELAKDLGTDSLTAVLLFHLLFLLFLYFPQEFSLGFLTFFIRIGVQLTILLIT